MWSRPALVLALVSVAAAGGCGGAGAHRRTLPATHTSPPAAPASSCRTVTAPAPRTSPAVPAPHLRLDPARSYTAHMVTSCGALDIALDVRRAPRTAASFVSLARRGFYDGLTFHRIVPGFVLQGGDPLGNGQGGPGYKVIEPPPAGIRYVRGVVAMAKTPDDPPGTSGSQFYIVIGDATSLGPDYALLGHVTGGAGAVDALAAVPNSGSPDNTPTRPVVIERVTVIQR